MLDGPCYHYLTITRSDEKEWDFWWRAMDRDVAKQDWLDLFQKRGFRAGVDLPIPWFYK